MTKNKTITATIPKELHIKMYLTLWNGMLELTNKELLIAEALVTKYLELTKVISDKAILYDVLFSSQSIKEIRTKLEIRDTVFNNYKASMKEKGVLHVDRDGNYSLDERIIPIEEITFKFILK